MTERQLRAITIDPFFDGAGQAQRPGGQLIQPNVGYVEPDPTMIGQMRPGPAGLRGTIIPRATMHGIPMGTNPHATADMIVNIDPHIEKQSSSIRLGDLTANSIAIAEQIARSQTDEPHDIQSLRLRGAAVMHAAASQSRGVSAAVQAPQIQAVHPQPVVQQPQQFVQPVSPPQPYPQLQKQSAVKRSPLMAFNQPQPQQPGVRDLRQIDMTPNSYLPQQPPQMADLPDIEVTFEVHGLGPLTVRYHDLIVEQGFLVLVYDTRCQHAMRYFPQKYDGENQPRIAMNVTGTDVVYSVLTTGIQFVHDTFEMCVLLIDDVGQL